MSEERRAVTPIRPAAAYIGGKRRLGELLARRIEAVPHETYAEPFVGMGGVFFRRRWAPRREVINDISRDVATLFRILQRHYPQFMETLKFQITSRAEFERLAASNADTLTDLEWAGRFLDLQRLAFGGKVAGRNFGIETAGSSRFDVTKLGPILEEIHSRRRRDRVSAVAGVHRPLRHGQDAVLSRSALLGLGGRLRRRRLHTRRVCRPGRAAGADRRPVHPVGQRRAPDPRDLPPLRDRGGCDTLHRGRRQMVRRDRDRRHWAVGGAAAGIARFAVVLGRRLSCFAVDCYKGRFAESAFRCKPENICSV